MVLFFTLSASAMAASVPTSRHRDVASRESMPQPYCDPSSQSCHPSEGDCWEGYQSCWTPDDLDYQCSRSPGGSLFCRKKTSLF